MIKLAPHETVLAGEWIVADGQVCGDATCERIASLLDGSLIRMCADQTGWNTLYRDPGDDRYWELTYPQSHLHGGGPSRLTVLAPEVAKRKYGLSE